MKNWRVELTTGGKSIAEVKIVRVISQTDAVSSLLFAIVMMSLNLILGNVQGNTNFINHEKRLIPKCTWTTLNWKIIGKHNTGSEKQNYDIWMEFGIEKCVMLIKISVIEKWWQIYKNQNVRRKGNVHVLGRSGSKHN